MGLANRYHLVSIAQNTVYYQEWDVRASICVITRKEEKRNMAKHVQPSKVLIIVASTRPGRIGRSIADWFYAQAREGRTDVHFELVDLADWSLPLLDEPIPAKAHLYKHEHTQRWGAKIAEGEGYVFVTPEYNHGYPASLKNALDYLYQEWNGKPVAFVSYGMGGGRMAVRQLRQVVDELQMRPLDEGVPIVFEHDMFDERHQLVDPERSLSKYVGHTKALVETLAHTLHEGVTNETAQ